MEITVCLNCFSDIPAGSKTCPKCGSANLFTDVTADETADLQIMRPDEPNALGLCAYCMTPLGDHPYLFMGALVCSEGCLEEAKESMEGQTNESL